MTVWDRPITDPLYGEIRFDEPILSLVRTPTVQRLRHVRLSNIDSLDMPAIANLSRYEHVLGVAHLAAEVGFRRRMTSFEDITFRAAALLHDWAITSYGHLVEEALQYVGTGFEHEEKLRNLFAPDNDGELGGANLQIFLGRESGLVMWARKYGGVHADEMLEGITGLIRGKGQYGGAIAGDIDLDNMDNVYRMAHHMGLPIDKALPAQLAMTMVASDIPDEGMRFRRSSEPLLLKWLATRREVYNHLMLSERDFTGKIMLLYAAVEAFQAQEILREDWALTDHQFIQILLESKNATVVDTAKRWMLGELWDRTELHWMGGRRPNYPELLAVSKEMSDLLERPCFTYAIKDKRERRLTISFDDGSIESFGRDSERWLVGIGSPKREPFTASATKNLLDILERKFGATPLGSASHSVGDLQGALF